MKTWTPEQIRELRKTMDLSQKAFSEFMGVTEQHVYYLERGVRVPSQTLRLLLDCVEEKHTGIRKRKGG
jgi:DNA-binding transcriptional regulator YiaG